MKLSFNIIALINQGNKWLIETPYRSLEVAYQAALKIKELEDSRFNGEKISPNLQLYTPTNYYIFESELNNLLSTIKLRISEFKTSQFIVSITNKVFKQKLQEVIASKYQETVLRKIAVIDEILAKYQPDDIKESIQIVPVTKSLNIPEADQALKVDKITEKTGMLPRSIFSAINKIQRELDPTNKTEEDVILDHRRSKKVTLTSIRTLLIFILVPLLMQQISRSIIISPVIDHFSNKFPAENIFLNKDLEAEALDELRQFEEIKRFESLIGLSAKLTEERLVEQVKEKADELAKEYRKKSLDAIKNILADIVAILTFCYLLLTRKKELSTFKNFLNSTFYNLSDSAKAFILILLTDTFVGFHSPHGWEVILERVSRHLGIEANRDYIFLFIATFPVILDTIVKYWIFRYLNQISPSAVATYKNMNE